MDKILVYYVDIGSKYAYEQMRISGCCGFEGTFSLSFPKVTESIFKRKYESIAEMGVSTLITDCLGCLIQFRGRVPESKIKALHTASVIADVIG